MTDANLATKLQTPERQPIHERILAAGLSDDHTYAAELLLALSDAEHTMRISTWVAAEIFQCNCTEWYATVHAIKQAGLATADYDGERAVITFTTEDTNA